jgi:hypothetical protein
VKLSDKHLVAKIRTLRETHTVAERELSLAVADYRRRRLLRVAAGEPAERPGEAGALAGQEYADAIRREQLRREYREADEAARRDPSTRALFG